MSNNRFNYVTALLVQNIVTIRGFVKAVNRLAILGQDALTSDHTFNSSLYKRRLRVYSLAILLFY